MMSACTFFGHRDCYDLDENRVECAVEKLIAQGVDTFYVGHQGYFDSVVYTCLKKLQKTYPHIRVTVVLAYIPTQPLIGTSMEDTLYPPIEGHPRFAVERRNRWMTENANYCLCYVDYRWGGAYKFASQAKRRGLTVINLGRAEL